MQPTLGLSAEASNGIGVAAGATDLRRSIKNAGIPQFGTELAKGLAQVGAGVGDAGEMRAPEDRAAPATWLRMLVGQLRQGAKDSNKASAGTRDEKKPATPGSASLVDLQSAAVPAQVFSVGTSWRAESKIPEAGAEFEQARATSVDPAVSIVTSPDPSFLGEFTGEDEGPGTEGFKADPVLPDVSTTAKGNLWTDVAWVSLHSADMQVGLNEQGLSADAKASSFGGQSFDTPPVELSSRCGASRGC